MYVISFVRQRNFGKVRIGIRDRPLPENRDYFLIIPRNPEKLRFRDRDTEKFRRDPDPVRSLHTLYDK